MSEMTNEREERILQAALDKFGQEAQEDKLIEEMAELTKAVLKYRYNAGEETLNNIIEEMADVKIMLNQMCLIYGDPTEWEVKKLERLEDRLGLIDGEPPF